MSNLGLSVRKMSSGDIGLCCPGTPNKAGDLFPLFRVPRIEEMVEILRQLHLQAVQVQNRSQWEENEAAFRKS